MSCGAVYHGWDNVRPLAGAGIEIPGISPGRGHSPVRPLAGAGIEIPLPRFSILEGGSPPRGGGN